MQSRFLIIWYLSTRWVPYFHELSVLGRRTRGGQPGPPGPPEGRRLIWPTIAHVGVHKGRVAVSPTLTQCSISQRIIVMNTQRPPIVLIHTLHVPCACVCVCVCVCVEQVYISVTSHSLISLAWDHNRDSCRRPAPLPASSMHHRHRHSIIKEHQNFTEKAKPCLIWGLCLWEATKSANMQFLFIFLNQFWGKKNNKKKTTTTTYGKCS